MAVAQISTTRPVPRQVTAKEMPAWYRSMLAACPACKGYGQIDPDMHPSTGERAYDCPDCDGEGCVARLPLRDRLWRNARRRDPFCVREELRARAMRRGAK